jgi:hypothetical protein
MYDLEIPFHRLIHHFVKRIFYGAGEGDELQFGIPALLGLLSTPAAFGAIQLLGKYSSLELYLRHRGFFDVYQASVPDEYFFIVYSMVITGAVVILKWDRLFPDKQDFDNLAVLPIPMRQIFASSLVALLFLATLFAVDINLAACFIFPFAVTSRYDTFAAYSEFFIAHALAVILASLFVCFALLSVMGLTMLLMPKAYFRQASLLVRAGCSFLLMATLGSAFTLPRQLLSKTPPDWAAYMPSVWFLDLHQFVVGRGAPFSGSAVFPIALTLGVFVFSIAVYAATYYRQFSRIPEQTALRPRRRDSSGLVRGLIEALALGSPLQRAALPFALKTIFRSERHAVLFGAAVAAAGFIGASTLADALSQPSARPFDSRLLSIPLTLSYFIICSLRALYDQPAERGANWVFRATVDRYRHEARAIGLKVMLAMIAPWLLLIVLPLSARQWGWPAAVFHAGYVLICCAVLGDLLLAGFRKIPFTCLHVVSKDRVLVMAIFFVIGFVFFSPVNATIEATLLQHPPRFVLPALLLALVHFGIDRHERNKRYTDRILLFEDRPESPIQVLDLSR